MRCLLGLPSLCSSWVGCKKTSAIDSPKPMGALVPGVGLQLHCLEVPVLTHGLLWAAS